MGHAKFSGILILLLLSVGFAEYSFAKVHKHDKTPIISEISTDFDGINAVTLTIAGSNLLGKNRASPFISLGYGQAFTILESTDDLIVLTADLPDGDYLLRLSHDRKFKNSKTVLYHFTIGRIGTAGSKGVQGATGPKGPAGPAGPMGKNGVGGAKGDPGLTGPAGPRGPSGPEGIAGPQGPPPLFRWIDGTKLSVSNFDQHNWGMIVELKGEETGLDLSVLCLMTAYRYVKSVTGPLPKNTDFPVHISLDEVRRTCQESCPVAFNNFIHKTNFKTRYWQAVDTSSPVFQEAISTLADLNQKQAPLFCRILVNSFWQEKIDILSMDIADDVKVKTGHTLNHIYSLVRMIEGKNNPNMHLSYFGNYELGYYDQPYPDALDELLEKIPWTRVHTTWAYPYTGTTQMFNDGWHREFEYFYSKPNGAFSVTSKGADGLLDTADDIRYDSINGYFVSIQRVRAVP